MSKVIRIGVSGFIAAVLLLLMFVPLIGSFFNKPVLQETLPIEEVIVTEAALPNYPLPEEVCAEILEAMISEFPDNQIAVITTAAVSADCNHLDHGKQLLTLECRLSESSLFGQPNVPLETGRFWFYEEPTVLVEINSIYLIDGEDTVDGLQYWVCGEIHNWFNSTFDNIRTMPEVWIVSAE